MEKDNPNVGNSQTDKRKSNALQTLAPVLALMASGLDVRKDAKLWERVG